MRMTLEECIIALDALLDKNASYDGSKVTFDLGSHSSAVAVVGKARQALAAMVSVSNGNTA